MDTKKLKELIPIESALERYGVTRKGRYWLCPFHNDTRPSLSTKGEYFKCWACGESGDVISFTMNYFNIGFRDAIAKLSLDFSLGLPDEKVSSLIAPERVDDGGGTDLDLINKLTTYHRVLLKMGLEEKAEEVAEEINRLEGESIGK